MIFPSAEKNFKKNSWNFRGFLFKIGFFVQTLVRPARQSDLITKSLNCQCLGDATKAVRWQAFLKQVFGDDKELINWLQRWCGYLLTGSRVEQIFMFLFGLGSNGKSVFADTIRHILGDYARVIAAETLTDVKRAAGAASPDLAALIGARLALSSELEEGAALAESFVKSVTGDATMTARNLYAGVCEFSPQFKLIMLGNHKPIIKGNDYGIWRRVRLIPFLRTFQAEECDPTLLEKLKAEAPHILAWMVAGCLAWLGGGLSDVPATVAKATGEYKDDQDLIGNWLAARCDFELQGETALSELYGSYRRWASDYGERFGNKRALGRALGERGFNKRRSNGDTFWAGISVREGLPFY